MHGKIARTLIFQKQHEFFSDVEVGTKIYDDFRHLMLKQQFSRKNRKSFSFFLSRGERTPLEILEDPEMTQNECIYIDRNCW